VSRLVTLREASVAMGFSEHYITVRKWRWRGLSTFPARCAEGKGHACYEYDLLVQWVDECRAVIDARRIARTAA